MWRRDTTRHMTVAEPPSLPGTEIREPAMFPSQCRSAYCFQPDAAMDDEAECCVVPPSSANRLPGQQTTIRRRPSDQDFQRGPRLAMCRP